MTNYYKARIFLGGYSIDDTVVICIETCESNKYRTHFILYRCGSESFVGMRDLLPRCA